MVVRKSSARPCANLARRSAVAGAITSRSFSWATAMCSIALESVLSGLSDRKQTGDDFAAGERGEGQGG